MDANDCQRDRFSTRTIGIFILLISVLPLLVGLLIVPVLGFILAIPIIILAVMMIAAPESRTCRLIREGISERQG